MKIAFYNTKPYEKKWFDQLAEKYGYEINFFDSRLKKDTAILAKGYDAVCAFANDIVDEEVINLLYDEGIRVMAMRCAGYDNVDMKAAYGKIVILRVPDYSPTAIAEHAAALMLSVNRNIHKAYTRTREFNFNINGFMGINLRGRTAGVIGTGKIGKVMVEILKGFGMKIKAYDVYPDKNLDVNYVSLDEIIRTSDVITLHCPLTSETRHMINRDTIAKMKDGVILVNTSRGALIDTHALIEGLKNKKFMGVGLDVYEEEEEYFFQDKSNDIIKDDDLIKLVSFPNVLLTSHQAYFTSEAMKAIVEVTLDNLKAYENHAELKNELKYQFT